MVQEQVQQFTFEGDLVPTAKVVVNEISCPFDLSEIDHLQQSEGHNQQQPSDYSEFTANPGVFR
jgi:hypothetical protein